VRKVLELTRESLVQRIFNTDLPAIDFGKSMKLTVQKERKIDVWFDDVGSTLEDLNFEKIIGLNKEFLSLFDKQKEKYDELKTGHDNIKKEIKSVQNEIDDIEIILQDYFLRLNNHKPDVLQEINNAIRCLNLQKRMSGEVKCQYDKFLTEFEKLLIKVHDEHPEIQIAKSIFDKFSSSPWLAASKDESFNKYRESRGNINQSDYFSSINKFGGASSSNQGKSVIPSQNQFSNYNPNPVYIPNQVSSQVYQNPPPQYAGYQNAPPQYAAYQNPPPQYAGYQNAPPQYAGYPNAPPQYAGYQNAPPQYAGYQNAPPLYPQIISANNQRSYYK
jgi:hypothetical protein